MHVKKKRKTSKRAARKWKEQFLLTNAKVKLSGSISIPQLTRDTVKSPLDCFYSMFSPDLLTYITSQTNLYASQHGQTLNADESEIRTVIAIILLSGYCKVPYRELHWTVSPDTHTVAVANAMSRNRFRDIFSNLHVANNAVINADRYYKVRCLFDTLNCNFKKHFGAGDHSINKTMIPYFGKHGTKQFIRGKPIRFGFMLWCLASTDGYLFHAEPYCGADTKLSDTDLGQGADVVLGLIEKCSLSSGSSVTFDNFFTSFPLLDDLSKRGIGGLGTIRKNRLENAAIPSKQAMKKTEKGFYDCSTDTCGNAVVVWHDTAIVTCASNYAGAEPESFIKRWSKAEKKKINVPMPHALMLYNQKMGGVDLFDQFVATYRARIRSKKWWWPFFCMES